MAEDFKKIIDQYNATLNAAVKKHEDMLNGARDEFQSIMEASAAELAKLSGAAEEQTEKPEQPESAWVKDHLVLNKPAAEMMQKIFDNLAVVLPEVAKIIKSK